MRGWSVNDRFLLVRGMPCQHTASCMIRTSRKKSQFAHCGSILLLSRCCSVRDFQNGHIYRAHFVLFLFLLLVCSNVVCPCIRIRITISIITAVVG